MRIEYDDDALTIIEKVNIELAKHGLEFEYADDDPNKDGFEEFVLKEIAKCNIIINAKRITYLLPAAYADQMTYDELVRQAYPDIKNTHGFTITVRDANDKGFSVIPGQIVKIEDEMIFSIVRTDNS